MALIGCCQSIGKLAVAAVITMKDRLPQALLSRAQLLLSRAMEASSFAEPEIPGIPEPVMKGFLEDGALSGYRLYLERILARKEHMLGEREERLLAGFGQTAAAPSAIFTMFNNADVRFPAVRRGDGEEIPVTHGSGPGFP